MKNFYLKNSKCSGLVFGLVFLLSTCFLNFADAQTYSKSILVNLGSNSCGSTTPYISLTDKSVPGNPLILDCNVSSTLGSSLADALVEYDAKTNYIYLAKRFANSTSVWRYDVGLPTQTFSCPTLGAPTYSYNFRIDNFAIDQGGDVYSISGYNLSAATAVFNKFNLATGAAIISQTVQFPAGNKPESLGSGDMTFVANGKMYAVFGSSATTSKLYEITNYGSTTSNAAAVFLKDIPQAIFGLAFINNQLQLSGFTSSSCYSYLYDVATSSLSASSAFSNGDTPVDDTSIYTSIGSTKRLLSNKTINSNTSELEYELHLQNTGNVKLQEVQLTDDLAAVFGAGNISNISTSIISNPSGLTLNPSFNGNTDKRLLNTGQALTNLITANSITIKLKVRVTSIVVGTVYPNRAQASGYVGTSTKNVQVSDFTNDGPPSAIYPLGLDTPTPYYYLVPFVCSPKLYLSQYPNPGQAAIYSLNSATNPFTITNLDSTGSSHNTGAFRYNAIGYNTLDNFIYGINVDGATNQLIQIDATGRTTDMGTITGLPTGSPNFFIAGDTDNAGNLYVLRNGVTTDLYKINIATKTSALITLSQGISTLDFAFNKITGKFYGFDIPSKTLYSFTDTGTVSFIGTSGPYAAYGAMFSGSNGKLFGNANNGSGFYQFNTTTGERTLISSSISSDGNDGAHCVNNPITFSSSLSVSKTDGKLTYLPGSTNTYTIVVKNSGPFGVQDVKVVDNVPSGIPAANVTYTAVASSGSTTNVAGTQTGDINDMVGLPVDGTITYTITLNVPASYTGNLTNTVTVTPPIESTDQTVKTASDTDTPGACYDLPNTTGTSTDTTHGITLLNRAGADNGNWPMIRKGGHTALESNIKGFVITRMTTTQINAIVSPQEGMMVYDTIAKCLKLYDGTVWSCFTTPACP